MARVKYRVDSMPAGTPGEDVKLEAFLNRYARDDWEFVRAVSHGDRVVLVHRRVRKWWKWWRW